MLSDLMTKWFGSSWRSTIGGILIGVPPLIAGALSGANIPVGKWVGFAMTISLGLGGLMLGTNAKDKQVHSTVAEVQSSVGHDTTPPATPPSPPKP
jgi:hypothetical protein